MSDGEALRDKWQTERKQYAMLDGRRDERIDRVAQLAARMFDVPFVRIALAPVDGRLFQSVVAWPDGALPLAAPSTTAHANHVIEIEDLSRNPAYAADRHVAGEPWLRFLASAPIVTQRGQAIGAVSISDNKPRKLSASDRALLSEVASLVIDELDMLKGIHAARLGLLAQIVEESPDFIGSADALGGMNFINPAGRKLIGLADGQRVESLQLYRLQPEWAADIVRDDGIPAAIERGTWAGESAILGAMGGEIPISQVLIAHRDEQGELLHISTIARDISDLKAAEHALRDSEARFRGTFDNAAVGIAHVGYDGRWLRVNQRLLDIVGYERDELLQMTWEDITPPADLATDRENFAKLQKGLIPSYVREKRSFRKDGSIVWINLTVANQFSDDGQALYCIAVIEDITHRKAAEARQRLLLAELNHRVKNTLATIQSIANQSLRRAATPKDFVESFLGRIQSLSSAHNLLNQETWEGADLATLVQSQVTVGGAIDSDRVICHGPPVTLPPQIALNLALVLHELATNAMKHGALQREEGRITVEWSMLTEDGKRVLDITWVETGGPPTTAPRRSGFGTMLVERGLEQGLGAETRLDWSEQGLRANFKVPLPSEDPRRGFFSP